mmetsp:Transcript_36578/g.32798  ORF Transcript_36578/g.32798 Transcript_36578/m.32798 type:complete len:81 (+) Transcript_36578:1009-1251(+)
MPITLGSNQFPNRDILPGNPLDWPNPLSKKQKDPKMTLCTVFAAVENVINPATEMMAPMAKKFFRFDLSPIHPLIKRPEA